MAAAGGEGATAVQLVHEYLDEDPYGAPRRLVTQLSRAAVDRMLLAELRVPARALRLLDDPAGQRAGQRPGWYQPVAVIPPPGEGHRAASRGAGDRNTRPGHRH